MTVARLQDMSLDGKELPLFDDRIVYVQTDCNEQYFISKDLLVMVNGQQTADGDPLTPLDEIEFCRKEEPDENEGEGRR